MNSGIPFFLSLTFILTSFAAFYFFYNATNKTKNAAGIIFLWLCIQATIAFSGFYTNTHSFPPRFIFLILPPLLFIIGLFLTKKGKIFIDSIDLKTFTYMHVVRVPVELTLYWLFICKLVPELMTFEGRNLDILSGITAPIIAYLKFEKRALPNRIFLIWNVVCLFLLLNIVINAILSAPTPLQQFAFSQPNIGVLYFPFIWLPGFIVPLILFSHLILIRQYFLGPKKDL